MRELVTGLFLFALLGSVPAARAHGAIAMGQPDDIATGGLAMGTGYNYDTEDGARARALAECRGYEGAPQSTRDLCEIVATFSNKCYAIALDPEDGTPGAGWAVAATKDAAQAEALVRCRSTAGRDRRAYCVVSQSDCDRPKT